MKVALVGYGKMGQLIDRLAPECGCEVALRLDEYNNVDGSAITRDNFAGIDAAIEFSTPHVVLKNVQKLAESGVNIVVGTTGWYDEKAKVAEIVKRNGIGLVWSANFSVGVNIFFRLVSEAAKLLSQQPDYEAWAWEIHHSEKKDAPSGTLVQLVQRMREAGYAGNIDESSSRAGKHPGTHEIGFDSPADTLTLTHVARNREGFARGALQAARWVSGKKGMFEFGDALQMGEKP